MMGTAVLAENRMPQTSERVDLRLWLIEFFLYFSLASRIFGNQLGVLNISGLSGAIIIACGFLCFIIMLGAKQPVPATIYFAFMINVIANITDLYHYELFSRNMVYWLFFQLMACLIVRNDGALMRFALFLAGSVFMSVYLGGEFYGRDVVRLNLEQGTAGSMFANANALAHISALTATSLCFSSMKCRYLMKLVCLVCAVALSAIVLMTLSRGGLIILFMGLSFYAIAVLFSRGARLNLIILGFLATVVLVVFSSQFTEIATDYQYRLSQDSARTSYLATAKADMLDTIFSGQGSQAGFSATGMKPHNAFLWLHLAFGGFCAWFFVAWVTWLGSATFRSVFFSGLPFPAKMEVLALFMMFFSIQFVSIFPPFNFGFVLAFAIIEKHIQDARGTISEVVSTRLG
jgi:hypothetical protein